MKLPQSNASQDNQPPVMMKCRKLKKIELSLSGLVWFGSIHFDHLSLSSDSDRCANTAFKIVFHK
jgi:hypothetical protein